MAERATHSSAETQEKRFSKDTPVRGSGNMAATFQRIVCAPAAVTTADVRRLQRSIGNRATGRLLAPLLQRKQEDHATHTSQESKASSTTPLVAYTPPETWKDDPATNSERKAFVVRRDPLTLTDSRPTGTIRTPSSTAESTRFRVQPVQTLSRSKGVMPFVQRSIVIPPAAYAKGIGVGTDAISDGQLREYLTMAVTDELIFAVKIATGEEDAATADDFKRKAKALLAAGTPQEKVNRIAALVTEINNYVSEHYQVYETDYTAEKGGETIAIPNRKTRYATTPEGGYAHSDPLTGKKQTKWGTDKLMWDQFAKGIGGDIEGDTLPSTEARVREKVPLKQLSWAKAKQLLPKSLLNLIFDVRFQLETTGAPVDERTPYEKARKDKSPHAPGTLRSWHQDSPGVLPANGFNRDAIPDDASPLHEHYSDTSQTGAGSSIGEGVTSPQGYAEYTGTGSNWEHNTKIVLDYINKRVYLTLTHYQYWALLKRKGEYEFWQSGTQEIDSARGKLSEVKGAETAILMSPWMEILTS